MISWTIDRGLMKLIIGTPPAFLHAIPVLLHVLWERPAASLRGCCRHLECCRDYSGFFDSGCQTECPGGPGPYEGAPQLCQPVRRVSDLLINTGEVVRHGQYIAVEKAADARLDI